MYVFGTGARGCYADMSTHLEGMSGLGATLQVAGGKCYPASASDPYFVTGLSFGQKERFSVVQCFDDHNYVYAFGHDPLSSMVTIQFIAFLAGTGSGAAVSDKSLTELSGAYAQGRLYKSLKRCDVTIAGFALHGFMLGMEARVANATLNLFSVEATLLMTEPKNV